eukprot:289144-Heterocapsa_arctica.AAC.3
MLSNSNWQGALCPCLCGVPLPELLEHCYRSGGHASLGPTNRNPEEAWVGNQKTAIVVVFDHCANGRAPAVDVGHVALHRAPPPQGALLGHDRVLGRLLLHRGLRHLRLLLRGPGGDELLDVLRVLQATLLRLGCRPDDVLHRLPVLVPQAVLHHLVRPNIGEQGLGDVVLGGGSGHQGLLHLGRLHVGLQDVDELGCPSHILWHLSLWGVLGHLLAELPEQHLQRSLWDTGEASRGLVLHQLHWLLVGCEDADLLQGHLVEETVQGRMHLGRQDVVLVKVEDRCPVGRMALARQAHIPVADPRTGPCEHTS